MMKKRAEGLKTALQALVLIGSIYVGYLFFWFLGLMMEVSR